jgi:hypothetical protein
MREQMKNGNTGTVRVRLPLWGMIVVGIFIFSRCEQPQPQIIVESNPESKLREPRISLNSASGGMVEFTVQLEAGNGNAVTGANVIVRDIINRTQVLRFNAENHCYTGTMENLPGVVMYTVEINSAIIDKKISVNVPCIQFAAKPVINILRDEDGNSVLSGDNLNGAKTIQAAWTSCGEGAVYQVSIRTSLVSVYAKTTEDLTISIPENTLSAANYTISIQAQKIYGDPLYHDMNYCSVSSISSTDIGFNVY